jgi:UDP-2,3-diacylglucosamine pyrophosphatase LpxH
MPAPWYVIDERLKEWATPTQARYIDAVNEHKSTRRAAKALGLNKSTLGDALKALEKKAALFGWHPGTQNVHPVAPGQRLRGASMLFKKGEAEPLLTWVKSREDDEQREAIVRAAVESLASEVKSLSPIQPAPAHVNADLLAVYPLGDPHFGMYSWAKESGEDFDLDIARRLTLGAADRLVDAAPPAETAIILPLGDVFHMDDQTNQTPAHRHQLDADGRFVKVLQVGIETFRHLILRALSKHKNVVVRFVQGNHDPHAIWSLAFSIAAYFDNEPRVTVDLSPSKFWYYRFGKVLIGATHGDTVKHNDLLGVMANDKAEDWGATAYRYWYTGHVHHQSVTELRGVVCESFRTLAARDAYAQGHGYRAGRDMRCIVHHVRYGEIERLRCDVAMVEDAIA